MKLLKIFSLIAAAALCFTACNDDDPDYNHSIFDENAPVRNEFDNWLLKNFTMPYNIEFNYLYNDKKSDNYYNVIPAELDKSIALAILIKHVWVDAYVEVAGEDFLRSHTFRVFQLIGSPEYDGRNKIILGTAEGGIKVTLFRVNELDKDNIYIETNDPYRDHRASPMDLNYWFFHTMHHEFCHILSQTKNYSTDFQTISAGKYRASDWVNVDDKTGAAPDGFVTGYATSEYNEDFAETYAVYVTSSDKAWSTILESAGDTGKADILAKLELVRTYFSESWGIDLDKLREVVLRRSQETAYLDLVNLK